MVPTAIDTQALAARIRRCTLQMTSRAGTSHIGSCLSQADLVAVLYGSILRFDARRPGWPERDRFILSKGHAGASVYVALSELGFMARDRLETYCVDGSYLSGHLSHTDVPGVELSTGSLGHGLSVGTGMAYALRMDGMACRVFVLMSDGECDEGSNWEAVLFAAHHGLANLVAIVDYNKIQSLGPVHDVLSLEPFTEKWRAFGWAASEVDGHDHGALIETLAGLPFERDKPSAVIAHTVKGKGVSFMENSVLWHYRCARAEEFTAAMAELGNQ